MFCVYKTVFKQEELKAALLPSLEKLNRQDPESLPFKQPVDPQVCLKTDESMDFEVIIHNNEHFRLLVFLTTSI